MCVHGEDGGVGVENQPKSTATLCNDLPDIGGLWGDLSARVAGAAYASR